MSGLPFWILAALALIGLGALLLGTERAPAAPRRADLSQLDRWDGVTDDRTRRIPVWREYPPADAAPLNTSAVALDERDLGPAFTGRQWAWLILAALLVGVVLGLVTHGWVWVPA